MKNIILTNLSNPKKPYFTLNYCDTFFSKLKGLMFTKFLEPQKGIILVETTESKLNASIHMLFMNFNISVIWLTKDLIVCDKALAKKWHPAYFPSKAAKFVIEISESEYLNFMIGDILQIENA